MSTSDDGDHEAPQPLYRRISEDLKARIIAGEYGPGDRLPSELELARTHGVSRITSRQALDLLGAEGLLVRRQGMGSFVSARRVTQPLVRLTDFVEDMAEAGLRPESRVLSFASEVAPADIAATLGIEPDAEVYRLDRLRLADGSPIALDRTWLPVQFGRLLLEQDLTRRTIYGILEGEYGIPIVSGEYTLAATVSEKEQAELLHVPVGAPLLLFERTSRTANNKAVYFQKRSYRADRVQYRLSLQRSASGQSAIHSFGPVFGQTEGIESDDGPAPRR